MQNLMHTELHCDEFVSMAFSPDSKYLVTLGGAPDWGMLYWSWEKSRGPMASTRVSSGDAAVYSVTFNPHDNTQVRSLPHHTFRQLSH
jgi:WD40 repeat protein